MRKWGWNTIHLLPYFMLSWENHKFQKEHYWKIEFQWIYFGIGMRLGWENDNYEEPPSLDEILA